MVQDWQKKQKKKQKEDDDAARARQNDQCARCGSPLPDQLSERVGDNDLEMTVLYCSSRCTRAGRFQGKRVSG